MPSVAKPTILDAINGAWLHCDCSMCSQPVEFQWHPRAGEPEAAWADESLFGSLCARCVLAAAEAVEGPPEDALQRANIRRSLRAHYRRIEQMWKLLGIRYEDTDPAHYTRAEAFYTRQEVAQRLLKVRQLIGLTEERQPTLVMERWYPPGQHKGPNDPYLELFMIPGVLPVTAMADVRSDDFAMPPRYLLGERTRNGRREVVAKVLLAIHACYPPASPVEIRWRWNPLAPDIDFDPVIHRMGYCDRENLGALVRHAERLYYKTTRSGRTRDVTKRWPPGTEDEFLELVHAILAKREQDDLIATDVEMLAGDLGMSRSALYKMFERVPEARDSY
jgi:hypothetical protein